MVRPLCLLFSRLRQEVPAVRQVYDCWARGSRFGIQWMAPLPGSSIWQRPSEQAFVIAGPQFSVLCKEMSFRVHAKDLHRVTQSLIHIHCETGCLRLIQKLHRQLVNLFNNIAMNDPERALREIRGVNNPSLAEQIAQPKTGAATPFPILS